MKLAFSTNAFKRYSLEDAVREIARAGYKGVEILCDAPHAYPPTFGEEQARSLRALVASTGMKISNLNAFTLYAIGDTYHPSWIESDERQREQRVRHTVDCIRLAKSIGAENLSTEPGGPADHLPGKGGRRAGRSVLEKVFLAGLKVAAAAAEEEGVKVLVEPEPGLLVENSSQFRQIMRRVNSDCVGLNFDIGHFYCVGEDPAKLVYELADYTGHFHLADIASSRVHRHLIPGEGAIDFAPVFKAMEEIGYQGFVTVELYPYQDNPVYAAEESRRRIQNIVAAAAQQRG